MKIFITGATGLVGRALVQRLLGAGHGVVAWVRDASRARNQLGPQVELCEVDGGHEGLVRALCGADAVINLAGENVMGGRWTADRRRALYRSRVELTRDLVAAMADASPRPRVLISASAVGYYGDRGDELVTEQSARGEGFLAELCEAWERAALDARRLGVRVAIPRIGIVLGHDGGMLASTAPLFRLGLGGPLGSGDQFVPFIHVDDLVEILVSAIADRRLEGPINAVAPHPVRARELARELGAVLGRPAVLPAPAFALRLVLGRRARVVLQGQRAVPARLQQLGFRFEHPTLAPALASILGAERRIRVRRVSADDADAPAGATYVLEARTRMAVPPDRAFDFFCRAENLSLITPSWLRFEIAGQPPRQIVEGTEIRYRIRLGPLPIRWKTAIRRWEPPRRFVDDQELGPYRLWWHEHRLEPSEGGSTMVDRVYYTPPFGLLGRLAHALWIAPTLRAIFGYRADVIARMFDATPVPVPGAGRARLPA